MPEPPAPLHELTASQAARAIREGAVSPVELTQALLARAEEVDPRVEAWETLDGDRALAAARAGVSQDATGRGPLHGVPIAVKDIFDTAGLRTAAGFGPYTGRVPERDAHAVAVMRDAGAIVLGKAVTTQWAYADPSRTRNPWSLADRTPGGSSSGSAAGVSARLFPMALGSQTAGSVLRPAAYNGVVGFKPTRGRISTGGVFPLAWSLDHVGVLARSVEDCAVFLATQTGQTALPVPSDGMPRLGLLRAAMDRSMPRVRDHLDEVARRFRLAGARVEDASFQTPWGLLLAIHGVTMLSEAAAVHWQLLQRFPGAHAPRIRAYAEAGRLLSAAVYLHAQRLRQRAQADADRLARSYDALLLPTAVDVAPHRETTGDASLQAPISLLGLPALSLPSGLTAEKPRLPFAIQIVGRRDDDARLLEVATWCERHLEPLPPPPL